MRWGIVFLASPIPLRERHRRELALLAARAWFDDTRTARFSWPDLWGEVRAASEVQSLGPFVGQRFDAHVEAPDGTRAVLRFLVAEPFLLRHGGEVAEA